MATRPYLIFGAKVGTRSYYVGKENLLFLRIYQFNSNQPAFYDRKFRISCISFLQEIPEQLLRDLIARL